MSKVQEFINLLKTQWAQPREAIHRGEKCPFLLACSFSTETADKLDPLPVSVPEDVREFWRAARSGTLFKDVKYSQWGIEILEPRQALAVTSRQTTERPRDFTSTDLVIARFLGDSDLLVVSCDPNRPNFGSVTIALPLDKREDWPVVAKSFEDFLQRLVEAQGDKYWETQVSR